MKSLRTRKTGLPVEVGAPESDGTELPVEVEAADPVSQE